MTQPPLAAARPTARTLFEVLCERAVEDPDRPAAVAGGVSRSYAELAAAAGRVAAALTAAEVGPGDCVALLMDNRLEWLEVAFGCAAVGARLAALNTWVKTWDLSYLLEHAGPKVLITLGRFGRQDFTQQLREIAPELWHQRPGELRSEHLGDLRALVVLGDEVPTGAHAYSEWVGDAPLAVSAPRAQAGDAAMVLYTSGSTARPKAVALTHGDLIENGFEIGERQGLSRVDRIFLASPLFWAFGGANALMASLTHGATLVLQSPFQAAEALDLLEAEQCTAIYLLPVMAQALLVERSFHPGRLRTVVRGVTLGTPSEIRLAIEGLGIGNICNIYGSTETYGNCCVTPAEAPVERRLVSQGPPLPGVEVRVVDPETGTILRPGEIGELRVRGRVTPGYLDTAGRSSSVVDAEGFYHTGDSGSVDESGWVVFASRATEMIKTSGINVSPAEVEDFLMSHPDVVSAAVTAGEDPGRGQLVVAFVKLTPSSTTPDGLRGWCRERLAGFKVPALVVPLDVFPTTPTGKIARKELKAIADEMLAAARQGRRPDGT